MPDKLSKEQILKIGRIIGYSFQDTDLLVLALTHRSVHSVQNYERIEFLGDSILNFLIGEALFKQFSKAKEGQLSRLRAELVKGATLANVAEELGLGEFLILGPGELKSGGQRRRSILADSVEAIIGAIYLESGLEVCRERIHYWFSDRLNTIKPNISKDSKTRLQEFLQSRQLSLPLYEVTSIAGEAHDQVFEIRCYVSELNVEANARGSSRRKAEQKAAGLCLAKIGVD